MAIVVVVFVHDDDDDDDDYLFKTPYSSNSPICDDVKWTNQKKNP